MKLTEGQVATITISLFRHRTDADGNCVCGRSKDIPVPPVDRMLTQQAHQAEVIARALHLQALNLQLLH